MAEIIVYSSITGSTQVLTVTGTTWGEVKNQIPGLRSDMRVMIKETKMDVTHDGAEMPVGIGKNSSGNPNGKDYTLFLMASKQKGASLDNIKEEIKAYIDQKFKELEESFDIEEEKKLDELEKEALKKEADKMSQ